MNGSPTSLWASDPRPDNQACWSAYDYFTTLSESPILAYFSSASPRPQEVFQAFTNYQKNSLNLKLIKMEDLDYLNYSTVFENTLAGEKPELRGDICVLSEYMLRSRKEFLETPLLLLYGVMAVESWFAVVAARGMLAKLMAIFMGAQFSGTAAAILNAEKTIRVYQQQNANCLTTALNSNGICNVDKLNKNYFDTSVSMAMALAFSIPKKALVAVTPAVYTSPVK